MALPNVLIHGVRSRAGRSLAAAFRAGGYYTVGLDQRDDYDYRCDRFVQFDGLRYAREADYRVRFSDILDQVLPTVRVLVHALPAPEPPPAHGLSPAWWKDYESRQLTAPLLVAQWLLPKLSAGGGLQLVCPPPAATPLHARTARLLFEALQLQSGPEVRYAGLALPPSGTTTAPLDAAALHLAAVATTGVWWSL